MKVTFTLEQTMEAHTSFFNLSAKWKCRINAKPQPLYRQKDPVPIVGRLGGPKDRSGRVRNFSHPQGFDPRTVQPTAYFVSYICNQ